MKLQALAIPQVRQFFLELPKVATLTSAVTAGLASSAVRAAATPRTLSILQGLTDSSTTQISVVVPVDETYRYEIFGGPGSRPQISRKQIFRADSNVALDRLVITGLVPRFDYVLTITDAGGKQIDQRIFRSMDTAKSKGKFAFVSCINDKYSVPDVWKAMLNEEPDMILFVGDTCYTDHIGSKRVTPDPKQIWDRHVETRSKIPIYFSARLVPVLATWDDHDFGGNNSDRTFRYAKESREIFKSFFPCDPTVTNSYAEGPGVSGAFTAFGQRFMLLDGRSGRTEAGVPGAEVTHWGFDQEKWIIDQAAAVNVPTFVFNGSEFFGGYHGGESVEKQHAASLARLGAELKKLPQVFVFGSGDVHYSEIMEIEKDWLGYPTRELVSSSIQSTYVSLMDKLYSNSRRVKSVAAYNYMLVESEAQSNGSLSLNASARGAAKVYFEYQATIAKYLV